MAKINYTYGIDIGTSEIRIACSLFNKEKLEREIVSCFSIPSSGIKKGCITDTDKMAKTLRSLIMQAEKTLDTRIHKAYVSIGGINTSSCIGIGSVIISRADQEITNFDIDKAIKESADHIDKTNKKIIETIPLAYKIDGKEITNKPEGMHGIKLEVRVLYVTVLKQNIDDLVNTLAIAHIEPIDIYVSSLISSNLLLSEKQKNAGCALLDIGYETSLLSVFENGDMIYNQCLPIGGNDITKDIALGLRIDLEEAENLKKDIVTGSIHPKRKIDEIIEARLGDIFELVNIHLKKLKRNELLPAGIIIHGGTSQITNISSIARNALKLPSRTGIEDTSINSKYKIKDPSFYNVIALALSSNDTNANYESGETNHNNLRQIKSFLKSIFSQLLP